MRSSRQTTLCAVVLSTLPILASLTFLLIPVAPIYAQNSEQVQVGPPPIHQVAPPAASASARELEAIGDELQADKNYLDAIDYYQAALNKDRTNAVLSNKVGMSQLLLRRYKEARKNFDRAIKLDKNYASAYANLAVVYYEEGNFRKSIRYYDKAIRLDDTQAVFYNNRAASLFAKKQFEKATADYNKALRARPRHSRSSHARRRCAGQATVAHGHRPLRLCHRQTFCAEWIRRSFPALSEESHGRGLSAYQRRLQRQRVQCVAEGSALCRANGGKDGGDTKLGIQPVVANGPAPSRAFRETVVVHEMRSYESAMPSFSAR